MTDIVAILGNASRGDVIFHHSGLIEISSSAAKKLCLTQGDSVDVEYCKRGLGCWIVACPDKDGGTRVWRSNRGERHFRAHSQKLCAAVMQLCACSARVLRVKAGQCEVRSGKRVLPLFINLVNKNPNEWNNTSTTGA